MAPASTTPTAPAAEIGSGDELQLAFEFGFWVNPWDARAFRISGLEEVTRSAGWPPDALSNHDISRPASRYALHVSRYRHRGPSTCGRHDQVLGPSQAMIVETDSMQA